MTTSDTTCAVTTSPDADAGDATIVDISSASTPRTSAEWGRLLHPSVTDTVSHSVLRAGHPPAASRTMDHDVPEPLALATVIAIETGRAHVPPNDRIT